MTDLLDLFASRPDDAVALLTRSDAPVTYRALRERVAALRSWLTAIGVRRGHAVAVAVGNGPAAIELIVAVSGITACVPLPAAASPREPATDLERAAPDLLITSGTAPATGLPTARVAVDHDGTLTATADPGTPLPAPADPRVGAFGLLIPTSGSTGRRKLVPLPNPAVAAAARSVSATLGLSAADLALNVMPLHHTHGLVGVVLSSLASGSGVVCLPAFGEHDTLTAFERHPITWYSAAPSVHARIVGLAEAGLLRRGALRLVRSASAPLPTRLADRMRWVLGVPVLEAYALTEAPGEVAAQSPGEPAAAGAVGRPRGCEVRVVDEADRPVVGRMGEIVVRGPQVAPGYLTEDRQLECFVGGWLRTGDLGRVDAEGQVFLSGRRHYVINRAGEKVLPEEVEEVLVGVPGVVDAVVCGRPDPVLGEAVVAQVVRAAGDEGDDEAFLARVREHARHRLSTGRRPDRIVVRAELPRLATGKADRRRIAADVAAGGPAGGGEADAADVVRAIWADVLDDEPASDDEHYLDCGGTSLQGARIEYLVGERFGVLLPAGVVLGEGSTVSKMTDLVRAMLK